MKMTGACLSVLLLCLVCSALPAHAQLTAQCSPECYGPRFAADGLANTTLGQSGNTVSYRFRAHHTGSLQKIHVYLVVPPDAGYSSGTGGQVKVTVNTDDGTSAHNPTSTVLASYLLTNYQNATPSTFFPIFTFTTPPSLIDDNLYHIVFSNPDPNPNTNFLSVDTLYVDPPPSPWQPAISNIDSAELLSEDGKNWSPRAGYLPILQLDFTDGWQEGMGYMESWVGAPQNISGSSNGVREQFTVSGKSRTVASVAVRVARTSGSDPLTVLLKNGDGSVIEQGTIPASAFPTASLYTWASLQFASAHTLAVGSQYSLELATASSSTYQTFPNRKGVGYNFASSTYYNDGYAQFRQNGGWVGWTQWGATNRTDGDLQFYFEVASSTSTSAPVISNLAAGSVTSSGALISWATDQSADGQVNYGVTTAYGASTTYNPTMALSHSQQLSGLVAGTVYHYQVLSANSSGNRTVSGDVTFTTPSITAPTQNSTAPLISGVATGSITSSRATVSWSTDQPTNGQVQYGTTTAYGASTALNSTLAIRHVQRLFGLTAGTLYHYRVLSTNSSGNQAISGDATFTTAGTTSSSTPSTTGVITFIQQKAINYASAASVIVTLNAAPHAGSALVLFSANNSVGITGVSGGGASWLHASSAGSHSAIDIWYGLNSSGSSAQISVSYSDATGSGGVNVSEFAGVAGSNALDVAPATNAGVSTTPTTPTATTTNANDLIVAAAANLSTGATTGGPTNSFIALSEAANSNKIVPAYRIVTATGSYSTSWTEPNEGWDAAIVALRAASGGSSVPSIPSVSVSSLTLSATSVNVGSSSTGTVTLSGAAPAGGATVSLSSNTAAAQVPVSVMVSAGATSATFGLTTSTINSVTSGTITASYNGTKTAALTVNPSGATFIQQKTATYASAGSVVVNLDATPLVGSALVMFAANNNVVVTGVSGGGVSWIQGRSSASHSALDIWYGLNSSGASSAITVTFTNAAGSGGVNVSEFSGVATANAIDVVPSSNAGVSTTPATPTATTANANDLIVAAAADLSVGATTSGPTNSFIALSEAANANKIIPAYRIVTTAGSYSTGWTESNEGWDSAILALKSAN